jgi:hypothetical protein
LLETRQTSLSQNEATRVVCEGDDTEKPNYQGQWYRAKRERRSTDRGHRDSRGDQQAPTARKGAELRHEPVPSVGVTNPDARDEGQAHADIIPVPNYHVIQALELRSQHFEIDIERVHGQLGSG